MLVHFISAGDVCASVSHFHACFYSRLSSTPRSKDNPTQSYRSRLVLPPKNRPLRMRVSLCPCP